MRKRTLYLTGAVLLLAFAGFAFSSFQDSLTPYVTFAEAQRLDRTLQVAGGLVAGSASYDSQQEALLFRLEEPETGSVLPVRYHGLKPANFEEAISIVAIGRWDAGGAVFAADKLLVKCPSKYQGVEAEAKQYG